MPISRIEQCILPPIKRIPKVDLPASSPFTDTERLIYKAIAKDIPQKPFPVVTELAIEQISKEDFKSDVNPGHVTAVAFYKRVVGLMDNYFDINREKFKNHIDSSEALLRELMTVTFSNQGKYDGLSFSVQDLFSILTKIIQSDELYSDPAQIQLKKTFRELLSKGSKGISQEGTRPLSLSGMQVWNIKSKTNIPHAHMIFDLALSNHSLHPHYHQACRRFDALKIAFQIRNDLFGITDDANHGNANLFISFGTDSGEWDQTIPKNLDHSLQEFDTAVQYITKVRNILPKSYKHFQTIQSRLLQITNIAVEVMEPITI